MRSISRLAALAAVAAGLTIPAGTAFADSDEQICEAAGGTYTKVGSVSTCEFPVGNSHNVKTDDQKGSFKSSHPEGYINPSGHRPPGQQG